MRPARTRRCSGRARQSGSSPAASSSSRCTTRQPAKRRPIGRGSDCIFSKDPSPREVRVIAVLQRDPDLPAGAADVAVNADVEFLQDATVCGLFPHTHLRGKKWEYMLELPDGTKRTILSVPQYDFNWQTYYMFTEPLQVPKGTKILSTAWYDNSAANRSNPDPGTTREVGGSDLGRNAIHRHPVYPLFRSVDGRRTMSKSGSYRMRFQFAAGASAIVLCAAITSASGSAPGQEGARGACRPSRRTSRRSSTRTARAVTGRARSRRCRSSRTRSARPYATASATRSPPAYMPPWHADAATASSPTTGA